MRLPSLSIQNPQFSLTIVLLLVTVGLVSYFTMPRSEDPQFDIPITLVEIIYPGASPHDIETLVVNPLEAEISDIENIKMLESQIKNGGARIEIKFLYGVDADVAYNKVKQAVYAVESSLPSGVQELLVLKATPTSVAIMQLALWSEPTDYKTMEYYAKQLSDRLQALPLVKKSDIWGYPQQVVAVDLNLALLKHHGLSVTEVNNTLAKRALNITPGFVNAQTRRFNVKASGNFKSVEALANTVVKSSANFNLRLKDVAQVQFADRDPTYLAFYDDKPVIFLTLEQRAGSNIFTLTEQINQEIENFTKTTPDDVYLDVLFKQSDSVASRVNGFFDNLWQGLILVGLMALLFLGVREALIVILVIPLSFLIAIGWLDFSGFGLQQMSIVGLIIALGLLVDNAIVVTESIHRESKLQPSLPLAAAAGASKVGWSITSGTVTTMLAFLPMLMMQSNTGDFVRSMPITVVLVLLASLLIALTLTPLLASRFLTSKAADKKVRFHSLQHYANKFAASIYVGALKKLISARIIVVILSVITLVGMLSLFEKVGVSLFPKAEKPMILVDIEMPPNASLSATHEFMQKVADEVASKPIVEKVGLNVGSANPRIYYNEIPKRGVEKYGQVLVVLKEYNEEESSRLVAQLRAEFATWYQAKVTVKEFIQGPVTDQAITIRLMSESLADLEKVAGDLSLKIQSLEGTLNLNNPIGIANTELALAIDYERAGLMGVDINTLDNTLQTILSGTMVGLLNDPNGENYPILVKRNAPDIDGLSDIYLTNNNGLSIPMNQVVTTKLQKGESEFYHYQKLRMAKVSASVDEGYSVKGLTNQVVQFLENYDLPASMHFILGGEEETRQTSFAGLFQVMLMTSLGIFAILVLQFRSFLQPLIIFTSIPFAMGGAILGLYITGQSFSMMAFVGLISLFGIVVNNAIILIDTVNKLLAEGKSKIEAVLGASSLRFTPILLTTLTTIVGLLPLTFFGGQLWQPLGVVLIAGLCVSALASFLLVPILTEFLTRKNIGNT